MTSMVVVMAATSEPADQHRTPRQPDTKSTFRSDIGSAA